MLEEKVTTEKNKMAIWGFILVLAGPLVLVFIGVVSELSDTYFPEMLTTIIQILLFGLPIAGIIISILCLSLWKKKIGNKMRALPIVALILCNPFFAFFYYANCIIITFNAAGLDWM